MPRSTLTALIAVVMMGAFSPATSFAQTAPAQAPDAPARPKFVKPIKGEAEIGYLKPVVKVVGNEVITNFKIKNLANGAIAGLKIVEFWYDKGGNMLPGGEVRVRQPILPGEIVDVTLKTPKNPQMNRNTYQFSHANGTCKPTVLPKF